MHRHLRRLSVHLSSSPGLTFHKNQAPTSSLYFPTRMAAFPPYPLSLPTLVHRLKLLLLLIISFISFRGLGSIVPSSGMQIHLILYQRSLWQLFRLNKRYRRTLPSILLLLFSQLPLDCCKSYTLNTYTPSPYSPCISRNLYPFPALPIPTLRPPPHRTFHPPFPPTACRIPTLQRLHYPPYML